jgi:histidinol-phosphatase (PHP family)
MRDYHVHSNYSDGWFLFSMVEAAEEAGIDGIGFTDHYNVSTNERMQDARAMRGYNLDITYERRRHGIECLREESGIEIYDAVEMDFTGDTTEIRTFLDEADFDYTIGSVHSVSEMNVQIPSNFVEKTEDELDLLVDRYFEKLIALNSSTISSQNTLSNRSYPVM